MQAHTWIIKAQRDVQELKFLTMKTHLAKFNRGDAVIACGIKDRWRVNHNFSPTFDNLPKETQCKRCLKILSGYSDPQGDEP